MDRRLCCPYCGQEKKNQLHEFKGCHICGYRSAVVRADDGAELMIVDRRMPYLERRCREIENKMPQLSVVVDRRIAQDDFAGPERRAGLFAESPEI